MSDPPRQRHPDHWHHDSSIIFQVFCLWVSRYSCWEKIVQVEDFTYHLHLSILQKLSPVFNNLLTIPHAVTAEATSQGTEENPIHLHRIEQEAFDDFLMWIYKM